MPAHIKVACLITIVLEASAVSLKTRSPVQKVIELMEENKEKITTDLAAEEKEMTEYSEYCDSEASSKGYSIKTAMSKMADLGAVIQECDYKIPGYEDEVVTQGNLVAGKEKELADAKAIRTQERKDFGVTESELVAAVGQLDRAASIIKKATGSFLQGQAAADSQNKVKLAIEVVSKVIDAGHVNFGSSKSLESLLQTGTFASDEGEEEQSQNQGKSSDIVAKIEEMKEKAEETLTQARDAEVKANNDFAMLEMSLNNAIGIAKDKIASGTASKGAKQQEMNEAKAEMSEITKSKSADESYLATLKRDCEEAAHSWEERQVSARGEIGAINKAIGILSEGVRVFLQVSSRTKRRSSSSMEVDEQEYDDSADTSSSTNRVRQALVQKFKDMSHRFGSYALMEMAGTAAMDPFAKIKGLIEEMIDKLLKEAQEEATQKAFCDQELGKSKKAKADKTATKEKLQSRLDTATTSQAELEQTVKELEAEVAELDKGMAEATKIRQAEHATYMTASKDFKDAADAVEQAIKVLKDFYEGASFLQTSARQQSEEDEDEDDSDSSSSKGSDAGAVIIGILEMCGEDFTKLLMETETEESQAQEAYDKLTLEGKVAKAAKMAEVKASLSQIKSLGVNLKDTQEDLGMTTKELEAVGAYLDELKPQCETKTMSYAEKKAKREAEIEGLKDALGILDGTGI